MMSPLAAAAPAFRAAPRPLAQRTTRSAAAAPPPSTGAPAMAASPPSPAAAKVARRAAVGSSTTAAMSSMRVRSWASPHARERAALMESASVYAGTTTLMTAYVAHKVLRVGGWT
jgi:hypothetical protein